MCISARTGEGTKTLLYVIGQKLGSDLTRVQLRIPYGEAAILDRLRKEANILDLQYGDDGVSVLAVVRPDLRARVLEYEVTRDA